MHIRADTFFYALTINIYTNLFDLYLTSVIFGKMNCTDAYRFYVNELFLHCSLWKNCVK